MDKICNYTKRLVSCGFSDATALRTVKDFLKSYPDEELDLFVRSLEREMLDDKPHKSLHEQ